MAMIIIVLTLAATVVFVARVRTREIIRQEPTMHDCFAGMVLACCRYLSNGQGPLFGAHRPCIITSGPN